MNTIKFISLGCSKNTVDSEVIVGNLKQCGWEILPEDSVKNPTVLIINTCGFIADAKQESIDYVLTGARLKKRGDIQKFYVMGCLSQRHREELQLEIPEVDAWFGVHQMEDLLQELSDSQKKMNLYQRSLSTPSHYAYLKIGEGCDRKCSFCAIPLIRGPHISRKIEDLVAEAKVLAAQGVKELILISQDLTAYGKDLDAQTNLTALLQALLQVEEIQWFRLQYLYPHFIPESLIQLMKQESRICSYLDIPLQHISGSVLQSMKRATNTETTKEFMSYIKSEFPNAALRTTLIVGYPNETESEFRELVEFVKDYEFDRLGVFTYSPEEGTSAYDLEEVTKEDEKQRRADLIMEIQEGISLKKNEQKIGQIFKVLIDREEGEYYIGRTEFDSPEVDNEVLIEIENAPATLKIGSFYNVKITEAEPHDLYGCLC